MGTGGDLGGDKDARYYVSRWFAGPTQTIVTGMSPLARYWSLTFYHQKRGEMVSFYDHQMVPYGQTGRFIAAVGGRRPRVENIPWADPTIGGGDDEGYLVYRIYKPGAVLPALPTLTFRGTGPELAAVMTCANLRRSLGDALRWSIMATRHQARTRLAGRQIVLLSSGSQPTWSQPFNARTVVPPANVTAASLVNQFADPNDVYHKVNFNVTSSELVVHGILPPISSLAPQQGVRYLSLCVYPLVSTPNAQTCLTDSALSKDASGTYTAVVSVQQPTGTTNWLNTHGVVTGTLLMRWMLPHGGLKASFCLPALAYRTPGSDSVPPLPAACQSGSSPSQ